MTGNVLKYLTVIGYRTITEDLGSLQFLLKYLTVIGYRAITEDLGSLQFLGNFIKSPTEYT